MKIEQARVIRQDECSGGYRALVVESPLIAPAVSPGQFVHLRVPRLAGRTLRRPFSVFRTHDDQLEILYKTVGIGTRAMADIVAGETVDLMGPLGVGFPMTERGKYPVLVAGGYGVAPLYLLAERLGASGIVFIGGAGAEDILCADEFTELGWETRI